MPPAPKPRKAQPAGKKSQAAEMPVSRVGDPIVHTGIYRVLHLRHRVDHFVVLLAGQNFPRCARCDDLVQFQLFKVSTEASNNPEFPVHVYEIPHPSATDEEEAAK